MQTGTASTRKVSVMSTRTEEVRKSVSLTYLKRKNMLGSAKEELLAEGHIGSTIPEQSGYLTALFSRCNGRYHRAAPNWTITMINVRPLLCNCGEKS